MLQRGSTLATRLGQRDLCRSFGWVLCRPVWVTCWDANCRPFATAGMTESAVQSTRLFVQTIPGWADRQRQSRAAVYSGLQRETSALKCWGGTAAAATCDSEGVGKLGGNVSRFESS